MTDIITMHIITEDPGTVEACSRFLVGLHGQVEDVHMSVRRPDTSDETSEAPTCDRAARTAIHRLAMALDEWADMTTSDEVTVVAGLRRLNGRLTELRADLDSDGA